MLGVLISISTFIIACHGFAPVRLSGNAATTAGRPLSGKSLVPTGMMLSPVATTTIGSRHHHRLQRSQLGMGILDSMSKFLDIRKGDFVKLDKDDEQEFGPGPILLLYNVPAGIENDEIQDILSDGAPTAFQKKCRVYRLEGDEDALLDLPLEECLMTINRSNEAASTVSTSTTLTATTAATVTAGVPVLFFSGFRNNEMMEVYNILGQEIYQESAGQVRPACAKAVPNAMKKPVRQILEEISGDHQLALSSD